MSSPFPPDTHMWTAIVSLLLWVLSTVQTFYAGVGPTTHFVSFLIIAPYIGGFIWSHFSSQRVCLNLLFSGERSEVTFALSQPWKKAFCWLLLTVEPSGEPLASLLPLERWPAGRLSCFYKSLSLQDFLSLFLYVWLGVCHFWETLSHFLFRLCLCPSPILSFLLGFPLYFR